MKFNYDIAIIDSEPAIATTIAESLLAQNIWAIAITNRKTAPLFLNSKPAKIIILDGSQYDNNLEFVLKIRDNSRKSKLIYAMESNITEMDEIEIRKYPVDMVIRKPYSLDNIINILNQGGLLSMNNYDGNQNPYNQMQQNPYGQQPPMNNPYGQPMGGMQGPMGGQPPMNNPYGQPMESSNDFSQQFGPNTFGTQGPNRDYGNQMPMQDPNQMQPMNNPYGQPMGGGMQGPMGGQPPINNPYGQPMDMNMGMQNNPYGQPMDQGPQQNPYGQPMGGMQGPMGGQPPMNNPYGQPMDMNMGMQNNPYGQPMDQGPQQNPYGQPIGGMQAPFNVGAATNVPGSNAFRQTVIAVNCPKGGVGKTTISKELAVAYATTRVNGKPLKVCLVDGNIGFGDVTTMLKVPSRPNIKTWTTDIQDKLQNNPDIMPRYSQQTIESEYLIKHQTGLYILAAPSNHADSLDIDADQMGAVIENLKNCDFDIIIIDTANNTQDYTLIALEKAQEILMVTTMEVTSISDTRALLTTLREIQFPVEKIKLVINKMPQKQDKDIDLNEIALVLQTPILGAIPDYPNIRKINNGGEPAMLGKDNELTMAIRDLANKIVPVFGTTSPNGKANFNSGEKKSFFGGLFGKKK